MTDAWRNSLGRLGFLILAATMVACSQPSAQLPGTDEEQAYDALQRKTAWRQIVEKSRQQPPQSLACRKVAVLAMFRLGMVDQNAAYECLANSHEVLSGELAAMMMSDVYMQLGMVNMAQRAAFEAMVKLPEGERSERALRRLTETAIITGQAELARKYVAIIERHFGSSKWLEQMKPLAEHPELVDSHPVFSKLKEGYERGEDQFFL